MAWFRRPLLPLAFASALSIGSLGACGRTAIDPGAPAADAAPPDGPAGRGGDGADSAAGGSTGGNPGARDAAGVSDTSAATLSLLPVRAVIPTTAPVQYNAYLVRGASAEDVTARATWSVDEAGIATITSGVMGGRLTAMAEGNATVRVTYLGQEVNTTVKVVDTGITSSALRPNEAMINLGSVQTFQSTATFGDDAMVDVTEWALWRSLDEKVATTSNIPSMRGVVRAVGVGSTTIVASFAGSEARATISVRAASRLTSIAVTPPAGSAMVGETFTFTAVGSYSDGTTRDLTGTAQWSSSNGAIAQVSFGRTRCLAAGRATITITSGGQNATASLACGVTGVMGVRLTPADSTTVAGSRVQFSATVFFMDGTSRDVTSQTTFSSANTGVASVGSTGTTRGVVTAIAAGTTMITGMYTGVTGTTSLAVTGR